MRDAGRLQNPEFEISRSLGSHMLPSYLHNDQVHLHHIQPPMQATESINFNPRSQIPSSSYRHRMNSIDDGNRNLRPSIPLEQRTNQHNPPSEVSRFRHLATRTLDEWVQDVLLMDGVRNSDISNRWFNNEDVPYEELLNLQPLLSRVSNAGLSRVSIDDGNRNSRLFIPIERRTNQDNLTSEISGIDLPAIHMQDGMVFLHGVRNSDWFNNEHVPEENALVDWEELPELSGHVGTGLSEETILRHLRTKTHVSSTNNLDLSEGQTSDQVPEICVICQGEYENGENVGTLQCGHEYHAECIMKWLQRKNNCPICKAKALPI